MMAGAASGPRSIAIVGPYLSGKTTLLESILFVTGAIGRKGKVSEGSSVGDSSAEARGREMGVEVNVASTEFMGDRFTFLDCPGSIEFLQDSFSGLIGVDAAVVVCEADPTRALSVAPILRFLDQHKIPRIIFVNKLDRATASIGDIVASLQSASPSPLVLRHIPIIEDETAVGYVDLASERAYAYKPGGASAITDLPAAMMETKSAARYQMLETLSDYDDDLMEKLLEDQEPEAEQVYGDLTTGFRDAAIAPVFVGVAENENGVRRLLKALRHEVPGAELSAARAGFDADGGVLAQVLKTYHTPNFGKLSVLRVWRGVLKDGATLNGERVSGLFRMLGQNTDKIAEAGPGEIVAAGRLEKQQTGATLSADKDVEPLPKATVLAPVYSLAIKTTRREDDVKLSAALTKVCEEDPSLQVEHSQDTNELIMRGQGEIHLRVATDRLANRYKITVETSRPSVPYKEAIKKSVSQHARFKRQSGGHGQFGDVEVDIKPLPRGSGFTFTNTVVGGSVPKQYIPAVEAGVQEYLVKGPLGFPVVDVSVTLTDGSYHAVDSSELAFKTAGRMAMNEGMPKCAPVLLEPILEVRITVPTESTAKVNALISGRRGQILGFEALETGGWDKITVQLPQSEVHDLIVELRSLSMGVGTYAWNFDHLQELTGRLADDVVAAKNAPD
jgi:elongation factor G